MWPREHGAYFQLGVPLAAALVVRPSVAGGLLGLAASAAFLAHEPLLVLRGQRGRRALERAHEARIRCAALAAVALAVGVAGLLLAPGAWEVAATVGGAGLAALGLSLRGAGHTLGGELLAATALSGAAAPVAVAGGMDTGAALHMTLVWALGFASTVVAVHVVIASHKGRASAARWALWSALLALAGAGIAVAARPAALLWVVSAAVVLARPSARHLRRVGVTFAVTAAAVAVAWVASVS